MDAVTVEDIEKAESQAWEAIVAFANNRDVNLTSELAEDVSMALIELTNLCYLRGKQTR